MTNDQIYAELKVIFEDILGHANFELTPTTTADQVSGWDSAKNVEILLVCEETFGVRFSSRELDSFKNVGDLVAGIARQKA